jgi:hypothetical protein
MSIPHKIAFYGICIFALRYPHFGWGLGFGYASILGASTEIDGFADPIFPSKISSKKMADTRYCGPPSY